MRISSLFEPFLVVFAFYAVYDRDTKLIVPCLFLVTAFLFEKLQERAKESQKSQSQSITDYRHYKSFKETR